MAGNKNLAAAKANKKDEFYTQRVDIENELKHYKPHFAGKVIYCNCDDPYESWFFKYFAMNFNSLGLKKLIATSYDGSSVAGTELNFDGAGESHAHKIIIDHPIEDFNGDGAVDDDDIRIYLQKFPPEVLISDDEYKPGDFRSRQCVELLKEADIVVTNPPFSLLKDYIRQLITAEKKFVILGNPQAIHYTEVFPLIKENCIWLGYKPMSADMLFHVSKEYEDYLRATKKEGSGWKVVDGRFLGRAAAIWFTNLDISKRHEDLPLYKRYIEGNYTTYDNFDAINIDNVADIPYDYEGIMGVPDSFLDYYNPDQFEILGADCIPLYAEELGIRRIGEEWMRRYREWGGTGHYTANMKSLVITQSNGKPKKVYSRILIRNKHPQKSLI